MLHQREYSEQISFFIPEKQVRTELNHLQLSYKEFHILTYKIDDAFQISDIMHYLPNPSDNIAYRVENLTRYISGAELTDDEREIIAPEADTDFIEPEAYDIGIFEDEKKQ